MISTNDWIEEVVEKTEKDVYGGYMPAHNKATLRDILRKEAAFWDREAVREDSHSPVGDWGDMTPKEY